MYGETEVIRKHVARLREQGGDVRAMADQLIGHVEGIAWSGRAADTMRERMRERASRLREAAGRHDVAADSLEKHLLEVESTKETIVGVERRAGALVVDARSRVAAVASANGADGADGAEGAVGVRRLPDPADEELSAFVPPEPGHKDWLGVELPGL